MAPRPPRFALGLRGRIVGAVLVTAVVTLGVAAVALLGPLESVLKPEWVEAYPVFRNLSQFYPVPYVSTYLWFDRKLTDLQFQAKMEDLYRRVDLKALCELIKLDELEKRPLPDNGAASFGFDLGRVEGLPGGTFGNQSADGTAVLIRYTLSGDSNLSGNVDLTDFTFLAANFNKPSGAQWIEGDCGVGQQGGPAVRDGGGRHVRRVQPAQ